MSNWTADKTALKNTMGDFFTSYAARDKNANFSNWLAERLQQKMPDMSADVGERLSKEIIEAVARYDRTLNDLDKAIESGHSKEEWFANRTMEACVDMLHNDAGGKLTLIYNGMNQSNAKLMREVDGSFGNETIVVDAEDIVEWNEYSLKDKALNIGRQAVMSGLGAAANSIKMSLESDEVTDAGKIIAEALQIGLETTKSEVKAVVAGAIKTVSENGLTDLLPDDTPIESICDMACAAVESAEALLEVAAGNSTVVEALDKSGRASVAAVCRFGANVLKGHLACIPVVGPIVAVCAGGLLEHMKGPKFAENVYTVVHDAAVATWEGIKETGRGIWNNLKNTAKELFTN